MNERFFLQIFKIFSEFCYLLKQMFNSVEQYQFFLNWNIIFLVAKVISVFATINQKPKATQDYVDNLAQVVQLVLHVAIAMEIIILPQSILLARMVSFDLDLNLSASRPVRSILISRCWLADLSYLNNIKAILYYLKNEKI